METFAVRNLTFYYPEQPDPAIRGRDAEQNAFQRQRVSGGEIGQDRGSRMVKRRIDDRRCEHHRQQPEQAFPRSPPPALPGYIEGINNLYEFDCGEQSGWMYSVNGWFPNYGCSRYQLKDGDVVGGHWNQTITAPSIMAAEMPNKMLSSVSGFPVGR